MKSMLSVLLLAFTFQATTAMAAYDKTYHQTEFWAGEYPNGFSVKAENVSVPARSAMDPALNITLQCGLPFRANYSPWNAARPARYFSASKIVPMIAKVDLTLTDENEKEVAVKKGELIEYLIYGAEGWFTVRYKGKEFGADQSLLEKVSYDESLMSKGADEWLQVTCTGGEKAWILLSDLTEVTPEGDVGYLEGLGSWYLGFRDYGSVTDLTDEDLKKEEP